MISTPTTVKLLEAACEVVGGAETLAGCLGIGESLLAKFMSGSRPLPESLFLRAVDIVLADRDSGLLPDEPALQELGGRPSTA